MLRVDGGSLRTTPESGYPGRGEATTSIVGTMAELGVSAHSGSVRLTGSLGAAFPLNDETLISAPGFTTVVFRPMFGDSGDLYIDHVLTPLVPPNATAILCVEFTGTVAMPGCCQGFATHGILAAYTTEDPGCADAFPDLCGAAACTSFETCAANLASALPDPAAAATRKAKRVATRLGHLAARASAFYRRGTKSTGERQTRLYARARTMLGRLRAVASAANEKATLGVPLDALVGALDVLLGQIPGS